MFHIKKLTRHLYFWVLCAVILGVVTGAAEPDLAVKLKPLGDGFIALVKMLISPVIFCTVVLGIAGAVGLTGILHLDDDLYEKDIRPDRFIDYLVEAAEEYFELNG